MERTKTPGYLRRYDRTPSRTQGHEYAHIKGCRSAFRCSSVSCLGVLCACARADRALARRSRTSHAAACEEYVAHRHVEPARATPRKAADFLAAIFEREGIPVTRYESAPGKAIVYARLKATVSPPAGKAIVLLHHMDVVPADRRAVEDRSVRRRPSRATSCGAAASMDMKGQGVAQLMAFLRLKRERVPLDARRDPAGRAGRRSRRRARRALDDREPLRRARSRVRASTKAASAAAICSRRTSWSTASRSPRRRSSG